MRSVKPIIICGASATGKSTVASVIFRKLELDGVRQSAGDLFRSIADKEGLTLAELRSLANEDPSIDIAIDRRLLAPARSGDTSVVDGRVLAWLAHQDKLDAHKVLLTVSWTVAARRLAKREQLDVDSARFQIDWRSTEDADRLGKLYGWNQSDESYYDQVIDTETASPEVIADLIISAASL